MKLPCRHCAIASEPPDVKPFYVCGKDGKHGYVWLHDQCQAAWFDKYFAWRAAA